jgi:NTE family protein
VNFFKVKHIINIVILFSAIALNAQKHERVGLVMSGGGAAGFAHIGVIKALEENGIKISYITGTSMGAIVGAFYSAGFTPDEMLTLFTSEEFMKAVRGKFDEEYTYLLRKILEDPSWVKIKLTLDSIETSLPGNLVSAHAVEMLLIKYLEPAAAKANYNFDSLMIPFRCVAADISAQKPVVFRSGNLSTAIRASSAYPLYFKPVNYNGHILFDGGIYDNFPISTMYYDFMPDYIIGSNVSYNFENPTIDNPISQIRNMIVKKSEYSVTCDVGLNVGVLIEPDVDDISTFDFDKAHEAFLKGYEKTLLYIDSIKQNVETVNPILINAERIKFKSNINQVIIDNIVIDGVNKAQQTYIKNALKIKYKKQLSIDELIPEYFKLLSENRIRSIFPHVKYNHETDKYTLYLDVRKEHDNILGFGGYFSNRPISEGFISLQYNIWDKLAYTIYGNSYFGKLYNSTLVKFRIDFPWRIPFYFETGGVLSKWDYFKSSSNFFEDIKPSFLVQKNNYLYTEFGFPVTRSKSKLTIGTSYGLYDNRYFQTDNFISSDTADLTDFTNYSPYVRFEYNSLNYPMYATKGTKLILSGRYINGFEETTPGNTNPDTVSITKNHQWLQFHVLYETYFNSRHKLKLGILAEGYQSNQPFFQNYTATILSAPAFTPIAEAKTYFLPNYRAHSFAGGGIKAIYSISDRIQFRSEGYIFQPLNKILFDKFNKAYYGVELSNRYYIWSNAIVYQSPFGPIAFNINYYDGKKGEQFSFLFHIGFMLYNKNQLD